MAQQLRELAALSEGQVHGGLQSPLSLVPRDLTPSSGHHGHCTYMVLMYMQGNIHTHQVKTKSNF